MTVATVDRPIRLAEMGRREAEEVTLAIKNNFDSLGSMLLQARDRKAYKALGYRSFEAYCKTEFGKSISHAYQLIEDVKAVAALEAEISKQYDEPITLKIPSSHLRPLKELPEMGDKLKAIEYANKLATAEGKQPTKKHLEIAVFQISGHRSDDFKSAIESLGFTKGTPVEMTKPLIKGKVIEGKGFVAKVDKKGRIHVELYDHGAATISCEASNLRILKDSEKPTVPANDNTINKGDRVRIFAKGLEGKTGEIHKWNMGKHAIVIVEGESAPTSIAYAELELIKDIKDNDTEAINVEKVARWEDSNWTSGDNKYYYFSRENRIYNTSWPTSLTLTPDADHESPSDFMNDWMEKFAGKVVQSLSDSTSTALSSKAVGISFSKTVDELVSGKKTQTRRAWQEDYAKNFVRYFEKGIAIPALSKGRHRGGHELGHIRLTKRPYQQYLSEMTAQDLQEEGGMVATAQEFIDGFFEGQDRLVWVLHFEFEALSNNADIEALKAENQRLREQLTEAESAIESMIDTIRSEPTQITKTVGNTAPNDSVVEVQGTAEFSAKNAASATDITPEETPKGWNSVIESNDFAEVWHVGSHLGEHIAEHKGWDILFGIEITDIITVNSIDIVHVDKGWFSRDTKVDFDIALDAFDRILEWTKDVINEVEDFCSDQPSSAIDNGKPPEVLQRITEERQKLLGYVARDEAKKANKLSKRELETLDRSLKSLTGRLECLDSFEKLKIGDIVCRRIKPHITGKISGFEISTGGMPLVWVIWTNEEGEDEKIPENLPVPSIIATSET
jgi:hypothetical protein